MQNDETFEHNSIENPLNDSIPELNEPLSEISSENLTNAEEFSLDAEEIALDEEETSLAKSDEDKQRPAKKERATPIVENFFKELDALTEVEAKIEFAIAFMEKAIAQENAADFKSFWEARMKCLSLFKENVPPFLRNQLWTKFSELSKEARRLKDMLDEQSDFAAEQIDMAITAIETGLDQLLETLAAEHDLELPEYAYALRENFDLYNNAQRELAHLNLSASRITSLRKELIKTEMRVRVKNKFFERMSKAGDRVFPRRKILIQEISQAFSGDINHFIKQCFDNPESRVALFDLREEIKALQSAAKFFTLNTQSFSQTRLQLSECWDKLKEMDKERKQEFDKKREVFKKNAEELTAKMLEASTKFEDGELNSTQSMTFLDEIVVDMRACDLGRDELKSLRQQISDFKDKIQAKQKLQDEERVKAEELRTKQKRELFESFKTKCSEFIQTAKEISSEELLTAKDELMDEIQKSALSKLEKNELDRILKPLKDILREKREQALLSLPADERQALEQLKELLSQKREQRLEIKERIEQYRKLLGASGLSFEKSMDYSVRLGEERENLEKAQESVQEIEMKIESLESKQS